ncbi:MAG TPA: efflux RND transporter periplasmic adaptor subunit [Pyrinomonadaceae bacterium]|jgi:RND family efflux transporter MFP subunit|nr:efflux RND transporter periplasmic adaptor subunit [Pyrinomonadaceae bacterium]
MNTRQISIIITAVALIALTIGCKTKAEEKPVKPVKVKTVETHSGTSSVRYSASIRPSSQVEVAFKVGGYVESIKSAPEGRHIQAGDVVSKGAVLAQLRQSDYAAKVNEARSQQGEARSTLDTNNAQLKEAITAVETSRAQLRDSEAALERARLDFERAEALFATQSITKPDYDVAKERFQVNKAKFEAAKAQLAVAEAKVNTARFQIGVAESRVKTTEATVYTASIPLGDAQLRAPLSAVVIERKVEIGQLVSTGTPAFVLADLSSVKAAFGVPDLALHNFKLGDTLTMTTEAVPGTEFTGHISRISPAADQSSRVFDVEVTIPNPQALLKPGMIASMVVNEVAGTTEVPVVPLTSITRSKADANAYAVLVIEEDSGKHIARLRNVTLGDSYGNSVGISSGVKPGEIVITTGVTQVADGEEVRVMP